MKAKLIDVELLREKFIYNHETGVVTRRVSAGNRQAGSVVGYINNFGHLCAQVGGRAIGVHRIAWCLYYGYCPEHDIDHINRNPADNRIANLRIATVSQNLANSKTYKNNRTGLRGIGIARNGKYIARIRVCGRGIYLGTYDDLHEAASAYQIAAQKYFREFASAN